jgi:hypothetical protein
VATSIDQLAAALETTATSADHTPHDIAAAAAAIGHLGRTLVAAASAGETIRRGSAFDALVRQLGQECVDLAASAPPAETRTTLLAAAMADLVRQLLPAASMAEWSALISRSVAPHNVADELHNHPRRTASHSAGHARRTMNRAPPVTGEDSRQIFLVAGERIDSPSSDGAQRLLAPAHAAHVRPMCLCTRDGFAMYIARMAPERYIIKRMPDTGMLHAPSCPSYLPPDTLSGLAQVMRGAIEESVDTGLTVLRLGFRLARNQQMPQEPTASTRGGQDDSVRADGAGLTLRAMLHYLWQEAGLTTWSPGMTGKRNWRVVSWHLRQAARGKLIRGKPLTTRLFIPEPFNAEHKAELAARRLNAWAPARRAGRASQFMIVAGEVKSIEEARFGQKLVIKHLPDAPFMLGTDLHRRMLQRFGTDLDLWQMDERGHLIVIATFSVARGGLPTVEELSFTMTDEHWLPYESRAEKLLLDAATEQRRGFTKSLRYNLDKTAPMASLVFTDTEVPTAAYVLQDEDELGGLTTLQHETGTRFWTWSVGSESQAPHLPRAAHAARIPSKSDVREAQEHR